MDAISNVGVWMDKIYMGERRWREGWNRGDISETQWGGHRQGWVAWYHVEDTMVVSVDLIEEFSEAYFWDISI